MCALCGPSGRRYHRTQTNLGPQIPQAPQSGGGFESSFGNNINHLADGRTTYIGLNVLVSTADNFVDGRRFVGAHTFTRLTANVGTVLPEGVSVRVGLHQSLDNGASYSEVASLVIPSGSRAAALQVGPVEAPANSLQCASITAVGGNYTGPVSVAAG